MIKKTTLLVLLGAVVAGAAAYYFDWKREAKEKAKSAEDKSQPAFSIPSGQSIVSITITRPSDGGEPAVRFEKRDATWQITQPIQTEADEPSVQGIIAGISSSSYTEKEPGTPDRLKVYGLDPPKLTLAFQLQNGLQHTLKLGEKDFAGETVYSLVDAGKEVELLPASLFTSADKPLLELRNRSVLRLASPDVSSFDLRNSSGQLAATKRKDGWRFTIPYDSAADASDVQSLLTTVTNAKWTTVASETPENLARYGLGTPAITFTAADDKGKRQTLLVGKKDGDEYFGRDTRRPEIFRISEALYKKLQENYSGLRDKRLVHVDAADVNRVEVHNANGTMIFTRKSEDEWTFEAPDDMKGKSAGIWKVLTPLTTARAEEVLDHPPASVSATLAKPAIEAILTAKNGVRVTVELAKMSGDSVYGKTSEGPTVFKLNKQLFDDLSSKAPEFMF